MKVRVLIVCIAACLCLVSTSFAAAEETRHDGNWWNQLEESRRIYYIAGFFDGMELGKDFSTWGGAKSGGMQDWAAKALKSYEDYDSKYFRNVTVGQVREGVTEFYKDFRNRSILLYGAVWIVVNQISGRPEDEVQKMIESFRKYQG